MKKIKKIKEDKNKDDEIILPEIQDRSLVNYNSGDNFNFEEKEFKANPVASKFFTLFDEKLALEQAPVIRVKHVRAPNHMDRWKIFSDNKLIHTIEGSKLLKKEREFLNTVRGFQLLLEKSKQDSITISSLKKEIRQFVESESR